jgi:hypothetical protein
MTGATGPQTRTIIGANSRWAAISTKVIRTIYISSRIRPPLSEGDAEGTPFKAASAFVGLGDSFDS